jgi:nucleoside-diphosphate-sugar epimerase
MVQADLSEPGDAARIAKDCDAIIHCAIGTSWGDPRRILAVTVGGTRHLLEEALHAGVDRVVHVSSMAVYGCTRPADGLLHESMPIAAERGDFYGASKVAAEREVVRASRHGLTTVIVRPARVFGPYSTTFVTSPLRAIAEGRFSWLGTPDVPADLVYVDNVAESIIAVAFASSNLVAGEAFNIGADSEETWRAFYDYFAEHLGYDLRTAPVAPACHALPPSRLTAVLKSPLRLAQELREIIRSPEFKSLGRRFLETPIVGAIPRMALERIPTLERATRRIVGAVDERQVYLHERPSTTEPLSMGSNGVRLDNAKLIHRVGFKPTASPAVAKQLTLDWLLEARLLPRQYRGRRCP